MYQTSSEDKLIIVMVGLPARGKSYISRKVARYLTWLQYNTGVFNVGERRRQAVNERAFESDLALVDEKGCLATFFDHKNAQACEMRDRLAVDTLDELLEFLIHGNGDVGILDATNTTRKRRSTIMNRIHDSTLHKPDVLFLESFCEAKATLDYNINLKTSGPDYSSMNRIQALEDFRKRVKMYTEVYEPLGLFEEAQEWSYARTIDIGRTLVLHRIDSYLSHQVVAYLMNLNVTPRLIWIASPGYSESSDNAFGRVSGEVPLSKAGEAYAAALPMFVSQLSVKHWIHNKEEEECRTGVHSHGSSDRSWEVWTSPSRRSIQTGHYFKPGFHVRSVKRLEDLYVGDLEGFTLEDIRSSQVEVLERRKEQKILYRYPGIGSESYIDLIARLQPVILDIERSRRNIVLIVHRAVARVLLAYLGGLSKDVITDLEFNHGSVQMFEMKPYGIQQQSFQYNQDRETWDKI